MPHILVVGGTGMLKNVSLYFASKNNIVSVIARNQKRFEELILSKDVTGFINPIQIDYTIEESLRKKLLNAITIYGDIDTAVCWIHSTAPDAPLIIAEILNNGNFSCRYFHILGSSYADPSKPDNELENQIASLKNIIYKKIILGFVMENNHARWLTNIEISNGVIEAIEKNSEMYIVGTVNPWHKRT